MDGIPFAEYTSILDANIKFRDFIIKSHGGIEKLCINLANHKLAQEKNPPTPILLYAIPTVDPYYMGFSHYSKESNYLTLTTYSAHELTNRSKLDKDFIPTSFENKCRNNHSISIDIDYSKTELKDYFNLASSEIGTMWIINFYTRANRNCIKITSFDYNEDISHCCDILDITYLKNINQYSCINDSGMPDNSILLNNLLNYCPIEFTAIAKDNVLNKDSQKTSTDSILKLFCEIIINSIVLYCI